MGANHTTNVQLLSPLIQHYPLRLLNLLIQSYTFPVSPLLEFYVSVESNGGRTCPWVVAALSCESLVIAKLGTGPRSLRDPETCLVRRLE